MAASVCHPGTEQPSYCVCMGWRCGGSFSVSPRHRATIILCMGLCMCTSRVTILLKRLEENQQKWYETKQYHVI